MAKLHRNYLKNSPTYADLFAQHGAMMPVAAAERFAAQHGTKLESLGLTQVGGLVATLGLVMELGY